MECKASVNVNAKSLKSYRDRYAPTLSLRTSLLPYERKEEGLVNVPLYLLFAIGEELKMEEEV